MNFGEGSTKLQIVSERGFFSIGPNCLNPITWTQISGGSKFDLHKTVACHDDVVQGTCFGQIKLEMGFILITSQGCLQLYSGLNQPRW